MYKMVLKPILGYFLEKEKPASPLFIGLCEFICHNTAYISFHFHMACIFGFLGAFHSILWLFFALECTW
jgi:hypothetical protein